MPHPPSLPRLDVAFTRPEKVLFPAADFTKGDLVRYYDAASTYLLPHLKNRPVSLIRFPDGVGGESFYSKNAPDFAPEWVTTYDVPRRRNEGNIRYVLINSRRVLAWCANLAAIEIHPFLHRAANLDRPTHVVFDLDPGEGEDLRTCAKVAKLVKKITDQLGLELFPKTSGSKGLQLYLPLNTTVSYDTTKAFAQAMAELLAQQHPDLVVSNMDKRLRKGRVLIDWSQNHTAKTTVSVYSIRGKREEPFVSMPVTWDELKRLRSASTLQFTPEDALKRLEKKGDLFAPVLSLKQRLPRAFLSTAKAQERTEPLSEQTATSRVRNTKAPKTLERYGEKRDFKATAEPSPASSAKGAKDEKVRRFVIQKHAATRLHFDLRLESGGTLKSWAVPKGLPTEPGLRRLAVEVEDHPVDYMNFEGTIPKGQYGGGTVMIWDTGTYKVTKGRIAGGNVGFRLKGKKLKGEWHLFRIEGEGEKAQWLVQKADGKTLALTKSQEERSVVSKRTLEQIAAAG
ncbi:MAG: non-homologous end-joining DNA ligase [Opitutaceae bacterium]|nr:non-homologous end-joining DNA ligase [Opitutaceae bacterium]